MKLFYLFVFFLLTLLCFAQSQNFTNTSRLKIIEPWKALTIPLIELNQAGKSSTNKATPIEAKLAWYQDLSKTNYGKAAYIPVMLVCGSSKYKASIFPYGAQFFTLGDSGVAGYNMDIYCNLNWQTNCVQVSDADGGVDEAIHQFEKNFNFEKAGGLASKDERENVIHFQSAMPKYFSEFDDPYKTGTNYMEVISACLEADNLRVSFRNSRFTVPATLWIDLKAKKVVRSVVDGVEMDINTGKGYAVPKIKK